MLDDVSNIIPFQTMSDFNIMTAYINRLNEDEVRDESAFLALTAVNLKLFTHFFKAIPIYQNTLTGNNPVSYSDYVTYQKLRNIFETSLERYELLKDETDLPYDKAGDYIECMLEEFSIFSRIHQSKTIDMDELVMHIDWVNTVDPEAYNKLFLPEVPVELRKSVLDMQNASDNRFDILLSEILVNYDLGLL